MPTRNTFNLNPLPMPIKVSKRIKMLREGKASKLAEPSEKENAPKGKSKTTKNS